MLRSDLDDLLGDVLQDRRLLQHVFYRRWEAGELDASELAGYAGQYRHFEEALPPALEEVIAGLDRGGQQAAASLVQANLHDERSVPAPHLTLFDGFADAVGGLTDAAPTPATGALVDLYRHLAASDPVMALAAIAAYEVQAPEIATSKADGLRAHYGLDRQQTAFWDVHGTMDADHASWTVDALATITGDGEREAVLVAARSAADAWWAFLDEREEAASQLAAC
jgi:pyrroloquinoline-quinone synthase